MSRAVHISSEVLFREIQGEAVLLDLRSQRYFGLDEVGTRMWQLVAEHGREDPVVEALLEEYEVERSVLARDLSDFLEKLQDAELLSLSDGTAENTAENAAENGPAQRASDAP